MFQITRINESQIALSNDANLTPQALIHGTIELEKEIAALECVKALNQRDVVYDIGAFIGDTALIFAKNNPLVYAFEPQPDAFLCLEYNTLKTGKNIECYNMAIGAGNKYKVEQNELSGNLGTRSISLEADGEKETVRIDSLGLHYPTFIKVDCEGHELPALIGATKTIQRSRPLILCEIYPEMMARFNYTPEDIFKFLVDHDYRYEEVIGNSTEPRWDILATPN